mmetsp:Transcript_79532/g.137968  ORF Transcript_79532/g.137968 Transcript_79532/m.137968 type:complete len:219 (-) Transcript_79532:707-1363(-)
MDLSTMPTSNRGRDPQSPASGGQPKDRQLRGNLGGSSAAAGLHGPACGHSVPHRQSNRGARRIPASQAHHASRGRDMPGSLATAVKCCCLTGCAARMKTGHPWGKAPTAVHLLAAWVKQSIAASSAQGWQDHAGVAREQGWLPGQQSCWHLGAILIYMHCCIVFQEEGSQQQLCCCSCCIVLHREGSQQRPCCCCSCIVLQGEGSKQQPCCCCCLVVH